MNAVNRLGGMMAALFAAVFGAWTARSEAPMKLRSAGDSLRGSLQPFDHQMPLSL